MGKTGTAERDGFDEGQDTSWFAAIAGPPSDQHVIVVMVEQGGHGSTTAAPIVRSILEDMYQLGDTGVAGTVATD
jgi:penicillin-binding protein 2